MICSPHFSNRVCEGNPELRAELESLLTAATSDKSFLEPSTRRGMPAGSRGPDG